MCRYWRHYWVDLSFQVSNPQMQHHFNTIMYPHCLRPQNHLSFASKHLLRSTSLDPTFRASTWRWPSVWSGSSWIHQTWMDRTERKVDTASRVTWSFWAAGSASRIPASASQGPTACPLRIASPAGQWPPEIKDYDVMDRWLFSSYEEILHSCYGKKTVCWRFTYSCLRWGSMMIVPSLLWV